MEVYNWIVSNKELLKIFYGLIIVAICSIIVLKADRLFRISLHQGIRYFRNAFFFYGLAFFTRYFLGSYFLSPFINEIYSIFLKIFLEFFLIIAGFFLLYSLIWKKIEGTKNPAFSSLANPTILIFYLFSVIIIVIDYLWDTYFFMFISQILIFFLASVISLINLYQNQKHDFAKFYFIAMAFSLIAWLLNSFSALFLDWNYLIIIIVSSINIIIFLLFLYGVLKITK